MTSGSWAALAVLLASWSATTSALADTETTFGPLERPDAATITVPDMAFTPGKADNRRFDEYFYFHKAGVSYERAFADLEQCRINSFFIQYNITQPRFIPLGEQAASISRNEQAVSGAANSSGMFANVFGGNTIVGTVGGVGAFLIVGAILSGEAEFRAIRTVRKCMAYKGYSRYGISRDIYKRINSGTDAEKQARMALIASGPEPRTGAIEP